MDMESILETVSFGLIKKSVLKAIIVYPSKKVVMVKVDEQKTTFTQGEGKNAKSYVVDEKAIYFFNKEPLLFYHANNPSPILISVEGQHNSMTSSEFQSVLESKAVQELLHSEPENVLNMSLILAIANTIGILVIIGINAGYINLGG